MTVEVLLPTSSIAPGEILARLQRRGVAPFSPERVRFVVELSAALLAQRDAPELQSLGFFCRPAAIERLRVETMAAQRGARLMPRGAVLHVTPGNVDTLFMYSWLLSFLCGNLDVLRLSDRESTTTERLLGVLRTLLQEPAHANAAAALTVLRFPHGHPLLEQLSLAADVRVFWGGDETITTLRAMRRRPQTRDVCFGDRSSAAVLNATAVLSASAEVKEGLASRFVTDAYWFDQLACASPREVIWVGQPAEFEAARGWFWGAVRQRAEQRAETPDVGTVLKKEAALQQLAMNEAPVRVERHGPWLTVIGLDVPALGGEACGGGFFLESAVPDVAALAPRLGRANQTLTTFGFDAASLEPFFADGAWPPDRIVPVGQALTFSSLWDGLDLFVEFTRRLDLRPG